MLKKYFKTHLKKKNSKKQGIFGLKKRSVPKSQKR